MGVFAGQLVFLAHQRIDHHVGGEAAFLGELTQPSNRHVQAIGQSLRQTRAVLDDGVKLLTTQHARGQCLTELQQGRLRFGSGCAGKTQRLRNAFGDRECVPLLTTQHAHRLLQLAVQRGGFLDRYADALGDVEQFLLGDCVLTLASGGQLQAR